MIRSVSCAAILAGGASSRMGREKALLPWQGQPLIRHVAQVLEPIFPQICVVTRQSEVARAAGFPAIADHFEARGPLGGIHAALRHFEAPTFIVACDMPFLSAGFIKYLSQNFAGNALVPLGESGFEPLHAVYAPHLAATFESYLGQPKVPSLRRILGEIDAQFVPLEIARGFDAQLKCFSNWNTPDDLPTGDAARAT